MAFVTRRKERRSRDTAEDSAHLYRLIAETIPQMVWTSRPDGGVDYVNRRVIEYTGLSRETLEGWGWKEVVHPEEVERCVAAWTRALQSGERYELEFRLRRDDGAYRWHHASAVPLRDVRGRIARWFGTCTDIEADVRSAQILEGMVEDRTRALGHAQRRLAAIIDTEPECVKLLDRQGRLLEMNAAGLQMIEAERAEAVLGACVYDLVAPEFRDAFRALTERVCRGERASLEFEMVGLKGTRRWMETHAVPFREDESGDIRLLGITRDVTARRRAENALRESEHRFRSFMQHAPAVAWIKDAALRYSFVSGPYEKHVGKTSGDMGGRDDFALWPREVAEQFRRNDREVLERGLPVQTIETAPAADGQTRHWLVVKFPLPDASGAPGVGGMGIDVTARVQAEEQVREQASQVRRLMASLVVAQESERRRLAVELHDLIGQNLTALGIDLATLRQRLAAEAGRPESLRLAAMQELVAKTIDAIRGVMTDLRPPALEEYGLAPALRWYGAEFSERTRLRAVVGVTGDERRLSPDAELALFRIAQEGMTNAAKHSGGSSVQVSLQFAPEAVRLVVEDDGHGFADPEGARSAGRGGWGLPAMRERAEAHGGTLRVEFPRGTRVVVDLPDRS